MITPVLTETGRRLSWEDAAASDDEEEADTGVSRRRAPSTGQKVNTSRKSGEPETSYGLDLSSELYGFLILLVLTGVNISNFA